MKRKIIPHSILLSLLLMLVSCQSSVEVSLPKILNNNMVLQRDQVVKIWGWGSGEGKVKVKFNGQTKSAALGADGTWMLHLDPMKAGGPFDMEIIGIDTTVLRNILIGDVWVCSGQSNMEWQLRMTDHAAAEIKAADYPEIRLFTVPQDIQFVSVDDLSAGKWEICSPETVPDFSSVGYLFGRNIHKETGIPIGLISSNWGGTNVETWTSKEMCAEDEEMKKLLQGLGDLDSEGIAKKKEAQARQVRESIGVPEKGFVDGNPVWTRAHLDMSDWGKMVLPGFWEENGLYGLDGFVWFRKEFRLSKAQADRSIMINLGAVDDSDQTWVNGVLVGETAQEYTKPRSYEVKPGIAREGVNHLVVRVEDTGGPGGIWGSPESMLVRTISGNIPLSGDWNYRVSATNLKISALGDIRPNDYPSLLYNGMINPLINYSIQGVIWYQGEANVVNAYDYRTRFPNMIQDWRNKWNNQDMGFYFVQLANFMAPEPEPAESIWAELREAQKMTLSMENTGMAVIIDIGEANDIHPRNKQDVAHRLALAALHGTYGKELVYSGPVYNNMKIEGNEVSVAFDHTGGGLVSKDGTALIRGFAIAGEDRKFYYATGKIVGNKVVLSSAMVAAPVAIRYAWADNPDNANLYNKEGLPAGPFRTDDWKLLTE